MWLHEHPCKVVGLPDNLGTTLRLRNFGHDHRIYKLNEL